MSENFKDLVIKNRSCRGFDRSRKVTRKELLEMVDCARQTASAVNLQPLKYFISADDEVTDKITEHVGFGAALKELHLPFKGQEPPAYIVICQDMNISKSDSACLRDVGIAAQTITLAATSMGLAGCMILNYKPAELKEVLYLPENTEPRLVIAIGKSVEHTELVEMNDGDSFNYYRDEKGTHYVPKRKLEDILIN